MGQLFCHEEYVYENFKTLAFTIQKFQISPKIGKNQSAFQNSVFLSKFDGKFSKVIEVIHPSTPTSLLNMKALAQKKF